MLEGEVNRRTVISSSEYFGRAIRAREMNISNWHQDSVVFFCFSAPIIEKLLGKIRYINHCKSQTFFQTGITLNFIMNKNNKHT